MSFVLDASFAAAFILPDEDVSVVDRAFDGIARGGASVPDLFWHELRNLLLVAEGKGRMPPRMAAVEVQAFRDLTIETRTRRNDADVLRLAAEHGLSAYDAAYLALAIELRRPLATLDQKLARAAEAADVPLVAT